MISIVSFSVFLYLLIMLPIGIYASKRVKNTNDYVLAGRSLPFYMALATVFATWFGSESILGASSKFAEGGFSNVIEDPFGFALCLIIIGFFFNKKLYGLNFLTIGDYFRHRYNTTIAVFLSLSIIISYFGWVAAQFLALGLVLSTVFIGLSLPIAIILSASLVLLYTYFGGMYSVAVLDTIQSAVIVIGLFAVFLFALNEIGGFEVFISQTPKEYFTVTPGLKGSLSDWIIFITALMTAALGSIPQQDVYQRAMSAKNVKVSMMASISAGFLYLTVVMIPLMTAGIAKILYPEIALSDPENLLLKTIENHTPVALQIVFFGALISAIVSTASGALLAPGTLLAENVIKPFFKGITDKLRLFIIRFAIVVVTIGSIVLAVRDDARIYELVTSAYSVTLVAGFIPLVFGLYSKKANAFGAFLSIILGVGIWQYVENQIVTDIPGTFLGFIASFCGMIIGTYSSRLITKEEKIEEEEHLKMAKETV